MNEKTHRNSRQRERLLSLLQSTKTHPTADWLYERLKGEFPSLSLGTVYRNLGVLEEEGRLVRISGGSSYDRYDARLEPHAHFICERCGRVYDMDVDWDHALLERLRLRSGHRVHSYILHGRGVCARCLDPGDAEDPQ